jgi:hypothetical protein
MLTGVEQGKTPLQIFQTDSAAGAILVRFDPMSGIADFHLEGFEPSKVQQRREMPRFSGSLAYVFAARRTVGQKTFYNLDLRRDQMLSAPLDLHDGFWFVNGFIDEKTVEEKGRSGYERIKCFYNLSGAGGPEKEILVGEHDYFAFPVDYDGGSIAPSSFGGMSGGGLWQVPLTRDADGQINHQAPLLSGVVF